MRMLVKNTERGLLPCYESDVDERKRLALGEFYWVDIKRARNYEFHKKFFALLKLAFDNLPEGLEARYPNLEAFREDLLLRIGKTRRVLSRQGYVDVAASIAFEKMGQDEFEELYRQVWNEITKNFVELGDTPEEIKEELIRFL